MTPLTYLFYDIETTGMNRAFDQIIQFASIRTDARLNEIDRYETMIKLRPDTIPSPGAMITHRMPIERINAGLCEYDAVRQIHRLANEPGTISVGYNTLGFDDEFLRFAFYRNLLRPYSHQYKNDCGRMDILPMSTIFWLYKNDVIDWPELEDGKPSLKLELISALNELAEGPAHDAMVDVEATIELARRFAGNEKMWNFLRGYFRKKTDDGRAQTLPVSFHTDAGLHRYALYVSNEFGAAQLYQTPVLGIGPSIPYSNQTLWLRLDRPELQETKIEDVAETTWVIRKKFGEPGILLPPKERYLERLDEDRLKLVEENLAWLKSENDLFQEIIRYYREYEYPEVPNVDADAMLYLQGFLTDTERLTCEAFHNGPLERKIELMTAFESNISQELAGRILIRNYPGELPGWLQRQAEDYLTYVDPESPENAPVDYRGKKRLLPAQVLEEAAKLRDERELDAQQLQLLAELEVYLKENFS